MRKTRAYFAARISLLERDFKDANLIKEGENLALSNYNMGDGTRYQVIIEDGSFKELKSFPSNYHMNGRDFDYYLTGMMDILDHIERSKNEK